MPFGLHAPELLALLFLAALPFGAKRLPELGSSVGKAIKEFQRSLHEVSDPVKDALRLPAPTPTTTPPDATRSGSLPGRQQVSPPEEGA